MQPADLGEMLDLGDDVARGGGHDLIEITCGLAVFEVAEHVALPRLDEGEVALQGFSNTIQRPSMRRVSLPSATGVP